MSDHWCRKCKLITSQHGDKWVPAGDAMPRPKGATIVVCTLCFHRARLIDGVDLSRPLAK